nr:MAG TPA: hypothetical protein [Caudoviricetes sp.]
MLYAPRNPSTRPRTVCHSMGLTSLPLLNFQRERFPLTRTIIHG